MQVLAKHSSNNYALFNYEISSTVSINLQKKNPWLLAAARSIIVEDQMSALFTLKLIFSC